MGRREGMRWLRYLAHPVALIIVAVVLVIALALGVRPPAARGMDAAPGEFSAERALVILRGLLAESEPHVAGSPLNRQIGDRIENFLRANGYEPEVQALFHCNPDFGSCASVENIIAVKPGSDGRDAVLLTAHYDSSWAGPGAGDDGAGAAAVLEIARMASQYGEFRNDLIFLLTDGEELGLIGAHAFATRHPLFEKVATVINLEARGVTGPSSMFETGEGNRSLIRILSKSLERPVANSIAYEVYKRMPNDTDYSVYRERGILGLNFAFTGGVALYHSRLDDIAHLDPASLQHHGQNAWSLVQALADRDIGRLKSRDDAAYIDVFGRVLWHYPVSIATGVTVLLSVLVLLGIVVAHKREITPLGVTRAIVAEVVVVGLLVGGAWLLNWPLGNWVSTNAIEHPHPWMARVSLFALCALAVWVASKLFAHRISFGDATLACWASFAALAFWLDFNLPAASFIALFPLAAFFIGMLLDMLRWRSRAGLVLATFFGFCTAAYMALYHFFALDVVLSFSHSHFKAAPLALMLLPLLPAWFGRYMDPIPDWRPAWLLAGVVLAAALLHQLMPGFSDERPRGMNLVYRQAVGDERALLYLESAANKVDPVFADTHDFLARSLPSRYASGNVAPNRDKATMERPGVELSSLSLPGVELGEIERLAGEDSAGETIGFSLQAPQACEQLVVALPEAVEVLEARVDEVVAMHSDAGNRRGKRPRTLKIAYPGSAPIDVQLRVQDRAPFTIAATCRQPLPDGIRERFSATWPRDSQPVDSGSRAEIVSEFELAPE